MNIQLPETFREVITGKLINLLKVILSRCTLFMGVFLVLGFFVYEILPELISNIYYYLYYPRYVTHGYVVRDTIYCLYETKIMSTSLVVKSSNSPYRLRCVEYVLFRR